MTMNMNKICKFYLKNNCSSGASCKFVHDKDICRNYFFSGNCKKNDECKFKHTQTIGISKKSKNTETFTPSHNLSDMNIIVGKSVHPYNTNDVIIVPDFLKEENSLEIYNKLLLEMENSKIDKLSLWKLWHGDTHLIADDSADWKKSVPTFQYIIDKISEYFNMDVKSTRFNLYKDSDDWKPFHHDAAAIKPHIARIQNFTVGVSFGATRSIAFEHSKTNTTISIPLQNGTAYAFSKDININWKHGIPQVDPSNKFNEGRISIIAWGKI